MPMLVLLGVVPFVSWMWIVVMARDMYGPMTGASIWMMTPTWDAPHLALLWAMWAVMMTGMMLPSAARMLLLYGGLARGSAGSIPAAARQIYALAAGYLMVWVLFSVAMTALQRLLASLLFLSAMMKATSPGVGGTLLLLAGAYELTPFKRACLINCRSPLALLMGRWRPGLAGAFRIGLEHGVLCLGCCWALMLILFAGGVMNLAVIAALTAFVAFEKLAPPGVRGGRVTGALLIAGGLWMLVR
jgi:predicted metal-binding membrane protein